MLKKERKVGFAAPTSHVQTSSLAGYMNALTRAQSNYKTRYSSTFVGLITYRHDYGRTSTKSICCGSLRTVLDIKKFREQLLQSIVIILCNNTKRNCYRVSEIANFNIGPNSFFNLTHQSTQVLGL